MLYSGAFSSMSQVWQPDGTCIITLVSKDGSTAVQTHLSDPYGVTEAVVSEKPIAVATPSHVAARMTAATAQLSPATLE